MKSKTPDPDQYCQKYLKAVYSSPLEKAQYIEVGGAFHAGIEAMCKYMMEDFFGDKEDDDDVLIDRLVKFRQKNKDCAMHINLLRFGEE